MTLCFTLLGLPNVVIAQDPPLTPVTILVRDNKSGEAIKEFAYEYWIETADEAKVVLQGDKGTECEVIVR